ncbi:unnamed protein product [Bursaphelenchus xylophilus]|uniref:(pine wood nematode) hypothetical protein n=1 Tax=Bursaphelenchus xylophilus TaxID=6326 RepID=A0A7I8X721_BURXY|nr:unnamed protein product [Bursaphelenchus xylophilus]CAG9126389.1 unnamed protein product [Bursaphelenchus xylophilus]
MDLRLVLHISCLLISTNSLRFLQIADFHYDPDYNSNGVAAQMCHEQKNSTKTKKLGEFGDYLCDSPAKLVENAVQAAAKTLAEPDLLLWTGDNIPHIDEYTEEYVRSALTFTTNQIKKNFPKTTVLPTLGNHDISPSNQFGENDKVYEITADLWAHWLKEEEKKTYLYGGYYSREINGEQFLVLNTNLYYVYDKRNFSDPADPAGQFEFTKKALAQAQSNNQTAHIIAHIPPGLYDRVPNIKWFTDEYNKQFLDIIRAYKDTIKLLIFGHHHGDTFHVIRDSNDSPINVAYISPAVTPWYSGLGLGANNPSFRVFDYNLESKEVTNVYTYNVNLTALNDNPSTPWTLEYSFKDAYGIPDFSPQSFHNLVEGFSKNETLFGTYMLYNTVSTDGSLPNSTIKQAQICSLNHADYDKYSVCISGALSKICSIFSIFFMMMLIML